jgi:hypothetical protein
VYELQVLRISSVNKWADELSSAQPTETCNIASALPAYTEITLKNFGFNLGRKLLR